MEVALVEFVHEVLHFRESHLRTAADMDEHRAAALPQLAFVEQRALERAFEGIADAVGAVTGSVAEEAARVTAPDGGDQLVHADADQAGRSDEVDDGPDTLADDFIRGREGFVDSFFREHYFAEAVVVKSDQRIRFGTQGGERLVRLAQAPLAFERERHDREDHDEGAFLAGHARDQRGGAGSGAASQPGADEDHLLVADFLSDVRFAGEHRLGAEIGIAARSQAAGQILAELEFDAEHGALQRAGVRVQGGEPGAWQPFERDGVKDVGAGAAEADDGDGDGRMHGVRLLAGEVEFDHGLVGWGRRGGCGYRRTFTRA